MKVLLARSASLIGYQELVSTLGGDTQHLLSQVGMEPAVLTQTDSMVSADALSRLLDMTADELNCPCFGLMLSQRQGVSMLGPVGLIMRQSPNFAAALVALQRYLHLHSEAGAFEMEVNQNLATIYYYPKVEGRDHSRHITDLSLGVGCNLVRYYCGKSWRPRGIFLQHEMPKDLSPYTMVFHSPISFSQEFNGMTFDAGILDSTVDAFEPDIQQFLDQYLEQLGQQRQEDFCSQVERLIQGTLAAGNCSLAVVARQLNLQPRTLQRTLARQGSSFQKLLDKVRQKMASEYLQAGRGNLTVLCQLLGYSELSVFTRAFKKWFGVVPSRYSQFK